MNTIDIIKNLCLENGTNVTTLCKQITGSSGNLPTWNKGNIRNDYLVKIADYFNVSTDYLLGKTEVRNYEETARKCMLRTPEEEQELNDYLEQVHNDPNLRMMFKLTKGATKADVEKAVEIIKTLLGK